MNFLSNSNGGRYILNEHPNIGSLQANAYILRGRDNMYAGQPEILAAVALYDVSIIVFWGNSGANSRFDPIAGPSNTVIRVRYSPGHFDAVVPIAGGSPNEYALIRCSGVGNNCFYQAVDIQIPAPAGIGSRVLSLFCVIGANVTLLEIVVV